MPWHFHRPTFAEIDMRRLESNFKGLKALLPEKTFICPMVKANAYGHGDIEVARVLRTAGAAQLGVGLIEEGMGLRLSGDSGSILLFGLYEERSADAVLEFDLTPVLSDWSEIESLESAAIKRGKTLIPVHVKFNSGMNRLGFDPPEARKLTQHFRGKTPLVLKGICTHLLRGEDAGTPEGESDSQLEIFMKVAGELRGDNGEIALHALNSSGLANLSKRVIDHKKISAGITWPLGARPGLGTYGVQPSNDEGADLPVQPVLSLKSRLTMLHRLKTGERVSYGATWRAPKDSLIGVVPAGYADGVFRSLTNRGQVLVRGEFAPMVGTVCMDYFMVDLTAIDAQLRRQNAAEIAVNDEVVLIGTQGARTIAASDIATIVGTIPYEILTRISERVPRIYLR
jgi:alanine racemase